MECLKEPSMERPENLKTPVKENQSIIWKSVLLNRPQQPQIYIVESQGLYWIREHLMLY